MKNLVRSAIVALLCALSARAGTVTGQVQNAQQGPLPNGTFTFTLTQAAVVSGTAAVVSSPVNCYTDQLGNVVGEPNPLLGPVLSSNLASGTLAAGTYFVKITYIDASGESDDSPESSLNLASQGTLIITAPVKQPANATGYKVYIGTSPGAETLQGSVTGTPGSWANFSQSTTLAAGSSLPVSNSTVCTLRFNDELQPSFVCYNTGLVTSSGAPVSGYPQYWYLAGGTSGNVNVSLGTPSSNVCDGAGVFYPQAILTIPAQNATQSISGGLNLNGFPFSAGATTVSRFFNNICLPFVVTDIGTAVNTCLAQGNGVDIWIMGSNCGTTITTQILVNNVSYGKIHGVGGEGYGCELFNGIVGNPAEPAVKITGTTSYFTISNLAIQGNNTAPGAGSTGNSISIIGTGGSPAVITLDNVAAGFTKGNGKTGTGASMPAAGIYVYQSIDIHITHANIQGNQQGVVLDTGTNLVQIDHSNVNGNTVIGIKAGVGTTVEGIEIGPQNDVEGNGTLTSDVYLEVDNCPHCSVHHNWFEANNGSVNFLVNQQYGQVEVNDNLFSQVNGGGSPSTSFMFQSSSGVGINFHDNRVINATTGLVRYFFVNPNSNGGYTIFRNNSWEQFAPATAQIVLQITGASGGAGCVIEGNEFGSANATGPLTISTAAVEISSGVNGCRVANNTCHTTSGTIHTCVQVDSGATNTLVENTQGFTGGSGAITNIFTDAGTDTDCIGAGCTAPMTIGTKPVVVARAFDTKTNQTTTIGPNTLSSTLPAGVYRISYYARTTSQGTGTTATVSFTWSDGAGTKTFTSPKNFALNSGDFDDQSQIVRLAASTAVTYTVTVASAGTSQWGFDIQVERLQ